jgi:sterol desaturase/sphingolipid hydroxylase (fatty acid hydroxylase superfamily)
MEKYFQIAAGAYANYWQFLVQAVLMPSWHNYFYWLVGASVVIYFLEVLMPWRREQPVVRENFWIDIFYLFWNYFLFSLVAYQAISQVFVQFFADFLTIFGIRNLVAISVAAWPTWLQLLFIFVFRDLMQYLVHRLLHRVNWMWEFHKVHHSTEQMGFAALMRYHFVENFIYRGLEYLPLAMIGFGIDDFFIVHIFTLVTGQIGHANLFLPLGRLKYVLNGPQMHLWHHAKTFPASHPRGINFGITLSIWDFIFRTNYWPHDDAELPVGLPPEDADFPKGFLAQTLRPFKKVFGK